MLGVTNRCIFKATASSIALSVSSRHCGLYAGDSHRQQVMQNLYMFGNYASVHKRWNQELGTAKLRLAPNPELVLLVQSGSQARGTRKKSEILAVVLQACSLSVNRRPQANSTKERSRPRQLTIDSNNKDSVFKEFL